ncbi:hypothetical protein ACSBR1_006049 [Camellia fascicularis]
MTPGGSGNRNGKRNIVTRSPQTPTRLATKKQSRLPFKKQKGPTDNVQKADVDPSKLMYRSNISGLISTVLELDLRDGHIRQLQKTPFWVMIDAIRVHELDPKAFKKCDATVCQIIQSYNPKDEKFHVGGAKLPLRNNNIRLIFGVQCGQEKLDLAQEAICGRTERDEEDVAKLLCLYVCVKLFFATTGEHIGWAFVRVIDKLDTLRQYDWIATIRNTLIGSLNEMYHRPEKVTGCVVALLFLICEHSNIITPERPNVTPRFCRWNIGAAVAKLKVLNLTEEGCIEVQCGKLVGTISECYILKLAAATNEPNECGRSRMDVDREGSGAAIGMDDVGTVEPSFNCWQVDTPNAGNIKMKGGDDYENKNIGTPTSKVKVGGKIVASGEVWPVLFPDLLELSSTPDGEAVGEEQGGVNDELRSCNVRIAKLESEIKSKDARVRELEQRVEIMEQLLGRHAGNLFVDLNSVMVEKDSEIDRLSKDSLDDFEVHEVTQCVVNDGSNQRTPSNSLSGKVSGSGHIMSVESAQHSACPVGQPKYVDTTDLQIVEHEAGIKDITVDFDHGNVHSTLARVEGTCSPRNEQPASDGNVNVGAVVVGVGTGCEHTNAATSSGPKMTLLVKRVNTKPRREFRLSDYEYPAIFG